MLWLLSAFSLHACWPCVLHLCEEEEVWQQGLRVHRRRAHHGVMVLLRHLALHRHREGRGRLTMAHRRLVPEPSWAPVSNNVLVVGVGSGGRWHRGCGSNRQS